jgi:hypothetical protein
MRGTRILTGAVLIVGLAAGLGWCAAAHGPDSLVTEALRFRLEHRSLARVTGPWGTVRLSDPRIGAAGLEFLLLVPEGSAGMDTAAAVPKPIPLDQVSRVQIRVGSSGGVAIAGGLLGAVLGLSVANSLHSVGHMVADPVPTPSNGEQLAGAVLGAVPGALLGALLGTQFRRWKTIYPEDPPPDPSSR